MNRSSTKNFLALALSALVLFSCSKEDDKPTTPNDPTNPGSQKCIITSAIETESSGTYEILFDYNGQRQITKASYKEDGVLETSTDVFEYNSGGRISKITEMDGTTVDGFTTYTYNSDGLLIRRESHYSNTTGGQPTLQTIRTYEYDNNKKLVRFNSYDGATPTVVEGYSTYTYPSSNTATEKSFYSQSSGGTPTLTSTTNYTFDDKKSPQQILGVFWEDEFVSEHNITREEYISASGGTPDVSTYTYEYNAEGFPTKMTSNYTGSTPDVLNLNYNCK
jgi:YD repeat-containing protein